jgi:Domain of unknown function (DUF6916)
MIEKYTWEMFADCLNAKFQMVDEPSGPIELELTQVSERRVTPKQEAFSVLFRGPADRMMAQRIHRIKHERLGEMDLFLVPVDKDEAGVYYEAVFNLLVPKKNKGGNN